MVLRANLACQEGDGLAWLEVGARFHLVLPNKEGAAKPRPYPPPGGGDCYPKAGGKAAAQPLANHTPANQSPSFLPVPPPSFRFPVPLCL